MEQVMNIHKTGHEIDLNIGKYKIDVLGGWGVVLGQFSISLEHSISGKIVDCKKSFWPVQSHAFNKRAKRIFIADISEAGVYKVKFCNPETLTIKPSNLFFTSLWQDPVPNEKISVHFHV